MATEILDQYVDAVKQTKATLWNQYYIALNNHENGRVQQALQTTGGDVDKAARHLAAQERRPYPAGVR